jgi:hypothetical protein
VLQCDCPISEPAEPAIISKGQFDVETHLAAAPGGHLVSAWIAAAEGAIGYAVSHDDGATWKQKLIPRDSIGREVSDPVIATDTQGNFYLTYLAFRRNAQGGAFDMKIRAHRLGWTEDEFGPSVDVDSSSTGGDKPWIAVTRAGTVVLTYMVDRGGQNSEERMARSTDQGATWQVVRVSSAPGNFIVPCTSKTGDRVWATFIDFRTAQVFLQWSDDDGQTWPSGNSRRISNNNVVVPPSCAAQGEEVWVAYPFVRNLQSQDQPADEYHVAHFDGKTLTDTTAYSKTVSHLGQIIAEDLPGVLSLTLYTGAREGDRNGVLQRVRSKDGGTTWTAISKPLTFTTRRDNEQWLGDYVGTATVGGKFYASYGDNSSGFTKIAFTKMESN